MFAVENFNDILKATKEVRAKLQALGVFSQVDMLVDTLLSDPHHYQVRVMVTERLWAPLLHCGLTSPRANVGAAVGTGGISNISGGGERLSVQLERGSSSHRKVRRHLDIVKDRSLLQRAAKLSFFMKCCFLGPYPYHIVLEGLSVTI